MSLPAKDFRTGISLEALAALKARAYAEDLTIQEIGRRIIEDWAKREIHASNLLHAELVINCSPLEQTGTDRNGGAA